MRKNSAVDFKTIKCNIGTGKQEVLIERVKEVWFAGSHSDVYALSTFSTIDLPMTSSTSRGGGHLPNDQLNLQSAPLLWMIHEAAIAGLLLTQSTVEWKIRDLEQTRPYKSLRSFWWILERVPIHRQSRSNSEGTSYL